MGICYFDFTKFFKTVNNISSWLMWIVFMVLPFFNTNFGTCLKGLVNLLDGCNQFLMSFHQSLYFVKWSGALFFPIFMFDLFMKVMSLDFVPCVLSKNMWAVLYNQVGGH